MVPRVQVFLEASFETSEAKETEILGLGTRGQKERQNGCSVVAKGQNARRVGVTGEAVKNNAVEAAATAVTGEAVKNNAR